jgi:DNA-binding MarR family transcriptional regulator
VKRHNHTIQQTLELMMGIIPGMIQYFNLIIKTTDYHFPMAQYRVLRILSLYPMNLSDLARKIEITKASLSDTIQLMVGKNWIEKEKDASDARVVILKLTPEGINQLKLFDDEIRNLVGELIKVIPEEELIIVKEGMEILRKYSHQMDQKLFENRI